MARIAIAGSGYPGSTGLLVTDLARARGHEVLELTDLDHVPGLERQLTGADAVVLVPKRGDAWRHAQQAAQNLATAAALQAAPVHLVLLSSFVVGHGLAHPLNRINESILPGRVAAERTLRTSGLPHTIVRTTWLTEDPAGVHAVTLTQDPHADGMLSRSDLAAVMLAAVEHPEARGTTFSLFNEPGEPPADWADSFARLRPDTRNEDLT
jgi:uncharacterized protein YbjT (DUF2867 family)